MTVHDQRWVVIGKFGRPHGVSGWLRVYGCTEEDMGKYQPWYVQKGTAWEAIHITGSKTQGKGSIVHIEGVDTPEAAKLYTNKNIGITQQCLPRLAEGEYYWSDLEGLTVVNQSGIELGKIDYLFETGANDVMVVVGKRRHMIPFLLDTVILDIDIQEKIVHVAWDAEF